MAFAGYDPEDFYDEIFAHLEQPRSHCAGLIERMMELSIEQLEQHRQTAEIALFKLGVT